MRQRPAEPAAALAGSEAASSRFNRCRHAPHETGLAPCAITTGEGRPGPRSVNDAEPVGPVGGDAEDFEGATIALDQREALVLAQVVALERGGRLALEELVEVTVVAGAAQDACQGFTRHRAIS